jgi:glycosyltransferase involved in cell wall biosynthesis
VDHILCKTRHAEAIFREHANSVRYIGFTSQDRRISGVKPDYGRFFHLAGRSALKGTGTLINVWSRHPEWPELTVVQSGTEPWRILPKNIKVIDRYLPDDELQQLQNECGIHLCPSLSEGWGHYVVEAMSCGAVVLTTDGAPMNEIVQPQHGVLVPWIRAERRHLGTNWYADPGALEDAITKIIHQPDTEKLRMGSAARNWFEQNDRQFAGRICGVASAILADYQAMAQPKYVSMSLGTAACEHPVAHQGTFS